MLTEYFFQPQHFGKSSKIHISHAVTVHLDWDSFVNESENSFCQCFLKERHLVRYFRPDIKHKDKYTLACACVHVHVYMHTHMHACTCANSSLNLLNISQSERLWKQQKHIWWFFLGSYSQLLFLPFQLHSGGHFIIIIDYLWRPISEEHRALIKTHGYTHFIRRTDTHARLRPHPPLQVLALLNMDR